MNRFIFIKAGTELLTCLLSSLNMYPAEFNLETQCALLLGFEDIIFSNSELLFIFSILLFFYSDQTDA